MILKLNRWSLAILILLNTQFLTLALSSEDSDMNSVLDYFFFEYDKELKFNQQQMTQTTEKSNLNVNLVDLFNSKYDKFVQLSKNSKNITNVCRGEIMNLLKASSESAEFALKCM
jgi:competence protein ComGF